MGLPINMVHNALNTQSLQRNVLHINKVEPLCAINIKLKSTSMSDSQPLTQRTDSVGKNVGGNV